MKRSILIILAVGIASLAAQQAALPITQYDYAIPENNVSPIAIGMGGLNLTYSGDPYCSYSNPALLAEVEQSSLVTSFRLANDEEMSILEATSLSNTLKDKQFKYFSLSTKKAAFTYQPMSRVNISEIIAENGVNYNLYHDFMLDKVQLSIAAKDEERSALSAGLNLKYLSGRLVYLKERRIGSTTFTREAFIDDKVRGFSTDLGFTLDRETFKFGLTAYDLFSRLYWENYSSKPIQSRIGLGAAWVDDNMLISVGLQGKISKSTDTTYHLGFQNSWSWGQSYSQAGRPIQHSILLRLGLYSQDFYGTKNIHFTMGSGYNYSIFRFDFSVNSAGMILKESEYLFSLGVGLP